MAIGTPVSIGTSTSTGVHSSNAVTTTVNILNGDLVVVAIEINSNAAVPTVSTVSDGTNTYTFAARATPTNENNEIWYCSNCVAVSSGATITANWSGSNGGAGAAHSIAACRISGIVAASALDKTNTQAGALASPSTTTGVLSQAVEIVIGYFCAQGAETQSAGFANINSTNQSGNLNFLDYQIVSSTASVTYNPSQPSAVTESLVVATFKGAFSGNPIQQILEPPLTRSFRSTDWTQTNTTVILGTLPIGGHTPFTETSVTVVQVQQQPYNLIAHRSEPFPPGKQVSSQTTVTNTPVWQQYYTIPLILSSKPIGGSTQLEIGLQGTLINRAYDWLVFQPTPITPVTPPAPVFTGTPGHVIPNYFYNSPAGKFGKGF